MFNIATLFFGAVLAFGDSVILSLLRSFNLGWIQWKSIVPISMVLYSLQPVIFLKSLKYESLTVMNLLWDVMSDVSVTIIGLFYFGEKLTIYKKIGVFLSMISVILLTYEDNELSK
jgi:drug/metabolite transporter (DMT)-like permease